MEQGLERGYLWVGGRGQMAELSSAIISFVNNVICTHRTLYGCRVRRKHQSHQRREDSITSRDINNSYCFILRTIYFATFLCFCSCLSVPVSVCLSLSFLKIQHKIREKRSKTFSINMLIEQPGTKSSLLHHHQRSPRALSRRPGQARGGEVTTSSTPVNAALHLTTDVALLQ